MGKSVVILDHPYTLASKDNIPHHRSYSAALADAVIKGNKQQGNQVDILDLYADHFDPVMHENDLINWRLKKGLSEQTDAYLQVLKDADNIFLIFPIWWGGMPAMTKGFLDKVLLKRYIYGADGQEPLFHAGTKVFVYTVSGAPTFIYEEKLKAPILPLLTVNTFYKLGIKKDNFIWENFNAEDITDVERIEAIDKIQNMRFS